MRNSVILEMNGLSDPTFMIESTPVVQSTTTKTAAGCLTNNANHNNNNREAAMKSKKLSRLALDNNFSPIVFHVPRLE